MATTPAALPKITRLPSGPIRRTLHYDQHVGMRPKHVVNTRFAAEGEMDSNGVGWDEFARMQTATHSKLNCGREEEETPTWALHDGKLRAVLVRYVELRAGFMKPQIGTEVERLQLAQQKILATKPLHELTITNLAREYVEMKRSGADAETLRKRAAQIENLDTRLLLTETFAAKALMALHLYYKMGWNSVQVGWELHLKPTHIRQMLYRIRKVAWKLGFGEKPRIGTHGGCRRGAQRTKRTMVEVLAVRKQATAMKYVATMTKLAEQNGGLIPTNKWLHANGYSTAYQYMLKYPDAFAHLRRKYSGRCAPPEVPKYVSPTSGKGDRRLCKRDAIVRSADFIALFEKARTSFRDPNRKTCKRGHEICAANAHVGDLRRTGKYSCDPCNRRIQNDYKAAHPSHRAETTKAQL
jgi:hypothetical protein